MMIKLVLVQEWGEVVLPKWNMASREQDPQAHGSSVSLVPEWSRGFGKGLSGCSPGLKGAGKELDAVPRGAVDRLG